MSGHLNKYSAENRQKFISASQSSLSDVQSVLDSFVKSVSSGTEKKDGWPTAGYAVSKAALTAASKVFDKQELAKGSGVRVEVCCPGYVNTDMSKGNGVKSPDEGAKTPVMLGLKFLSSPEGKVLDGFWQHEKVVEW